MDMPTLTAEASPYSARGRVGHLVIRAIPPDAATIGTGIVSRRRRRRSVAAAGRKSGRHGPTRQ